MKDFNIAYHRLIQLRDKLLLFGGTTMNSHDIAEIVQYDIKSNKWSKLDRSMPVKLGLFAATAVLNGQYVITFGGYSQCDETDDIWIYSVQDKEFRKSKIRSAITGNCQAFTINNKDKDEKAVFGYIRAEWNESEISDNLFPPRYLIRIINRYYMNEWVHLWSTNYQQHCRINVFDILSRD